MFIPAEHTPASAAIAPPPLTPRSTPDQSAARKARKAASARARKLRQREESRGQEQREAIAFAEHLKAGLHLAPSLESEINKFVTLLQTRGSMSRDRVGDAVRLKLAEGCTTVEEICEETDYSERAVSSALEGMRAVGTAKEIARPGPSTARGAAQMMWVLTGESSRTSAVLP